MIGGGGDNLNGFWGGCVPQSESSLIIKPDLV
jgi:hypothetical protein